MNVICLDEMHKKFVDGLSHINSCIVLPLAALAKRAEGRSEAI